MQRTNIYLDETTLRSLKLMAAARKTTMSDLVREAVANLMRETNKHHNWTAELRAVLDAIDGGRSADPSDDEIIAEVRDVRKRRDAAKGRST